MNIEEQFTGLCDEMRQSIIDKRHDGTYTADEAGQLLLMLQERLGLPARSSRGWNSSSWCGDSDDY
jgi:hypothetical protein